MSQTCLSKSRQSSRALDWSLVTAVEQEFSALLFARHNVGVSKKNNSHYLYISYYNIDVFGFFLFFFRVAGSSSPKGRCVRRLKIGPSRNSFSVCGTWMHVLPQVEGVVNTTAAESFRGLRLFDLLYSCWKWENVGRGRHQFTSPGSSCNACMPETIQARRYLCLFFYASGLRSFF